MYFNLNNILEFQVIELETPGKFYAKSGNKSLLSIVSEAYTVETSENLTQHS